MKSFTVITLLFVVFLCGGVYLKAFYQPTEESAEVPRGVPATAPESETSPTSVPKESVPTTPVPATKPVTITTTPKPAEVAVPTVTCVQGGSCTQEEVAMHHTRADCYVSMSNLGKVYDVTDYVRNTSSVHPGGDIAEYCGMDIFTSFTGQTGDHRHSGRAMQDLSAYEFASLQ